jgi:hypothetical protein
MSFTYAKCYTAGLVAFGANGSTNHYATRPEVQAALQHAETNRGWAPLAGMTVHEDNLRLLLSELGSAVSS